MFSALIIDADPEAAVSIQASLSAHGFEFTSTQDANEAMNLARTATPDIIFLRVELPNVSGFSVCNKLRRSDETKYVPLVMYASGVSDDVFNQHRNLKTHADEYIKLPFADGQLFQIVRGLIDMPEGGSLPAAESEALDVDIEDVEEEASRVPPVRDALEMREFDAEFEAMSHETGPHAPIRPRADVSLGVETDAAFDALTLEAEQDDEPAEAPAAAAVATVVEAAPEADEQADAEPEPEPEPAVASEPASTTSSPPAHHASRSAPDEASPAATAAAAGDSGPEDEAAPTGPGEFRAQREAIALKAQLNAKNREILALREEVESRDRTALDLKHKNRELLAQIGDIEEKLVGLEEEIITAREKSEAATRDKNTILKREEGLKGRLEHAQKKIKDAEDLLAAAQATAAAADAKLNTELAAAQSRLAVVQREHTEQLERADRLERELGASAQRLGETTAALEQARARSSDLTGSVTNLEQEAVVLRRDVELARREGEEDRAAALVEARELADADKAAALKALSEEQQAEVEFADGQRRAELEKIRTEGEEAVAAARADVENLRAQITEAEQAAASERDRTQRKIAELKSEAANAEARLTGERDTVTADLARSRATMEETAADLERTMLALRSAESDLGARREAARRAEQALAIAMRVLDERAAQ